jgi:rod shape-determining protein MreC
VALSARTFRSSLALVVLLAIPAVLLRASWQEPPGGRSSFDRMVWKIGGPLEAGLTYSANWVASFFQRWIFQASLFDDNRNLEQEIRGLKLVQQRLEELERENTELRRSMQLRERRSEDMVAAEVISGEASPFFRRVKLRIDRGEQFVKPGMAVLDADGVVGRVRATADSYSDVMLITDPASKVAVEVARLPGCFGIVEGRDELTTKVRFACEDVILVGDVIQTSGVDGLFPKAHRLGKVAAVDQATGVQDVIVAPSVRFDHLRTVWVVLAEAPAPDPDAGRPLPHESALGVSPVR